MLAILLSAAASHAQSTHWLHPDGTHHWYEAVAVSGGISWDTANQAAARAGGTLATITSTAENAFVFGLVDDPALWTRDPIAGTWTGPWLGGVQYPGAPEPAGGWAWAEFEPFSFSRWASGQPDDQGGADRIGYGGASGGRAALWADAHHSARLPGYVVEYAGPTVPRTMGLIAREAGSFDGYTLFSPFATGSTYLIDLRGRLVHEWITPAAAFGAQLEPNGDLLRTERIANPRFVIGGVTGMVERLDWNGNRLWRYILSTASQSLHHDIEVLPNGNILMIVWELKTQAEAIAAGRDPNLLSEGELWPDAIIEVRPTGPSGGQIVWEWHAWDHLIQDFDRTKANHGPVAQHPERIDLNYRLNFGDGTADWMHSNSLDYHAGRDQILLSVRHYDEVWILDHSTTTAEAAGRTGGRSGRGGDILCRWGNPLAYRAGTAADQRLFQQHDAQWIDATLPGGGNLLVFNNGRGRPGGDLSSADEVVLPTPDASGNYPMTGSVWGPRHAAWSYGTAPSEAFYSIFVSGAQRLASGNTLVCSGWTGDLFEVTPQGATVWRYAVPSAVGLVQQQGADPASIANRTFRSPRYPASYAAFTGRSLTAGEPIEGYSTILLVDGSTAPRHVRLGDSVELSLIDGDRAGRPYLVVTSVTPGELGVDYRFIRVGADLISIFVPAPNPVFQGYLGFLDVRGRATARLTVPAIPALAGIQLYTAFAAAEPGALTDIGTVSNTVVVRVR